MKKWHWGALIFITLVSLVVEFFFIGEGHDEHWWSVIPGFYIILGFAGCVLIIFLSKAYGKKLVQRKEDYYDYDTH
jgi:uncharacterized membrane protein YuzA (DUF378 family)